MTEPTQAHIYTVSAITKDIQLLLENTFTQVWVEGEVSNYRPSAAGHHYFSLKDSNAILNAVIFNRAAKDVKFALEDGLQVICFGTIEVYPPHGKYQLIIERVEPKGIGSLQLALEKLKEKLQKEGLFAPEHKRPIPYLPATIGVVTSTQGAAIKDIFKVLEHRFNDVHVICASCRVQGEGAKEEIAQAIADCNAYNESCAAPERIEVLIVGRGGGSIEDLWAFNEEIVARAIYHSKIPVISAVGHERDWTIADLVADVRAATPSVAAQMVIPRKEELRERILSLREDLHRSFEGRYQACIDRIQGHVHRLFLSMDHCLELDAQMVDSARKKLRLLNPVARVEEYARGLTFARERLQQGLSVYLKIQGAQFKGLIDKFVSLSPLGVLQRGYSITFQQDGVTVIKDIRRVRADDEIVTRLQGGSVHSRVMEVSTDGRDKI